MLLLGLPDPPPLDFNVRSVQGLQIAFNGVPVVRGSWFEYVEPKHYSSQWNHQKIETLPSGDVKMSFRSGDKRAFGSQVFTRTATGIRVDFEFFWTGDKPASVELGAATLWAPPLRQGGLFIDGVPKPSTPGAYRQIGGQASDFVFQSPFGTVRAKGTGTKWLLSDARNLDQPWVDGRDVWLLGAPKLTVRPNEPTRLSLEWSFDPGAISPAPPVTRELAPRDATAILPPAPTIQIIPKPKEQQMDPGTSFVLGDDLSIDLPDRLRSFQDEFVHFVRLLWNVGEVKSTGHSTRIFTRIDNQELPPEGYEIWINPKTAIVRGEDELGLRHALRTLAQLVYVKDGKLCLPTGRIKDWPSTSWRGVHLFGGPNSLPFHERLWENVLAPLKFNKAVIQCERTDWLSQPSIKTELTTPRETTAALFALYRRMGIEPIPLIQSFGHMEWLFANGQNLDLASHPDSPYRIDPTKPKAREAISRIWDEAVALLNPKTVHFGLDEVDARSFKEDPETITKLWEQHLPFLGEIARKHSVDMMLWGDKGLARGEGIDAAHGDSLDHARRRRSAIPPGATIADWHYKNDPSPERFLWSLDLWQREGFKTVATTWFNPENIYGFYRAAIQNKSGTLQSTWAGHEAGEEPMLREFRQFSAMVLAADYAWSGRKEPPSKLGYKPEEAFAQMFFGFRSELKPRVGWFLGGSRPKRIGDVAFSLFEPVQLYSLIGRSGPRPAEATLRLPSGATARELAFALDTTVQCNENDPIAEIDVVFADGTEKREALVYGRHARSQDDARPTILGKRSDGLTAYRMKLSETDAKIDRIVFRALSTYAGLRVHAVTGF